MPRSFETVLAFIHQFWKENHYSPSSRDIADHFETSTSVINYYLLKLEARGLIQPRDQYLSRIIVPADLAEWIEKFYIDENIKKA